MNILTLVCCWLQTAKYDDTPSSAAGFEAIVENADKTSEMLIVISTIETCVWAKLWMVQNIFALNAPTNPYYQMSSGHI